MLGQSATFISAPRSEALRNARSAPPTAPRASAQAHGRGGLREQILAPVDQPGAGEARRQPGQDRDQRRVGLGEDHVARPGTDEQREEGAGREGRAVQRAPRQREAAEAGVRADGAPRSPARQARAGRTAPVLR